MQISGKKAQEELIGFGLIIVVVSVVLMIFLVFSIKNADVETMHNYQVNSFLQSYLQYTSDCEDNLEYLSMQKLISRCYRNEACLNGKTACGVLKTTTEEILSESWKIKNRPINGYQMKIFSEKNSILFIKEGNLSGNSRGATQTLPISGEMIKVSFEIYG